MVLMFFFVLKESGGVGFFVPNAFPSSSHWVYNMFLKIFPIAPHFILYSLP
jgi:hypothetical protein